MRSACPWRKRQGGCGSFRSVHKCGCFNFHEHAEKLSLVLVDGDPAASGTAMILPSTHAQKASTNCALLSGSRIISLHRASRQLPENDATTPRCARMQIGESARCGPLCSAFDVMKAGRTLDRAFDQRIVERCELPHLTNKESLKAEFGQHVDSLVLAAQIDLTIRVQVDSFGKIKRRRDAPRQHRGMDESISINTQSARQCTRAVPAQTADSRSGCGRAAVGRIKPVGIEVLGVAPKLLIAVDEVR